MNNRTRLTLLIIAIAVFGFSSQSQPQASVVRGENRGGIQDRLLHASSAFGEPVTAQAGTRLAGSGDIATGLVIAAAGSELRLNVRPCDAKPFVVVFHQPYTRSTRGQKDCGGQAVTIEQIQQN